jgi:hypothetical protein
VPVEFHLGRSNLRLYRAVLTRPATVGQKETHTEGIRLSDDHQQGNKLLCKVVAKQTRADQAVALLPPTSLQAQACVHTDMAAG